MNSTDTGPIVVGYDGSPAADAAVDWAAQAALTQGLPLSIVVAVDYPGSWSGLTVRDLETLASAPGREPRLADLGCERAAKLLHEDRISTRTTEGSPARVLKDASHGAAMLVVGNRHHSELGSFAARSVTFALTAYAHCAVVAVPTADETVQGHGIVVGTDGSAGAQHAVARAAQEAVAAGCGLTVVGCWTPSLKATGSFGWSGTVEYPELDQALSAMAETWVEAAAEIVRGAHSDLDVTTLVVADRPVDALVTVGSTASLLVVGSHGRTGVASMVLGSVSHGVLHHSAVPVMVSR